MRRRFLKYGLVILFAFFLIPVKVVVPSGASNGKKIFNDRKCSDCHSTEKTAFNDKGPALWYAGSKFKGDFLKKWLANPLPIRAAAYRSVTETNPGGHPGVAGGEAMEVARYLMGLKAKDVPSAAIKPGTSSIARALFEKKGGCYGCHRITKGEYTVGGLSGPSLENAGMRLNADWIYAYLKNSRFFDPNGRMPVFSGFLSDEEMKALAGYVSAQE
ncbi:MAG: c-type cytochrome [Deltaproteobacteria bacterium]|nr:c-type cytochrome [Deltaproteobacteria bacterium]